MAIPSANFKQSKQMNPTKQARAKTIETCVLILSRCFGADPKVVWSQQKRHGVTKGTTKARNILFYHMLRCGFNVRKIAEIFDLTEKTILENARNAELILCMEHEDLVKSLPMIPSLEEVAA